MRVWKVTQRSLLAGQRWSWVWRRGWSGFFKSRHLNLCTQNGKGNIFINTYTNDYFYSMIRPLSNLFPVFSVGFLFERTFPRGVEASICLFVAWAAVFGAPAGGRWGTCFPTTCSRLTKRVRPRLAAFGQFWTVAHADTYFYTISDALQQP